MGDRSRSKPRIHVLPIDGQGQKATFWSKSRRGNTWRKRLRASCGQYPRRVEMKWWQIRKRDADLERELQSDMELEEEEQREKGLSAEEARRAARRGFGNTTLIREQVHESWGWAP